jgi:hypothetical protein
VDVPLVILASSVLVLAAVLAYLGMSYQPELAPLPPAETKAFRSVATSVAAAGALLLGMGALGLGGLVLAGVVMVAFATARA